MGAEYQVIVRNTAGAKQFAISDFLSLAYSKRRNRGGSWIMTLDADHAAVLSMADKWLVEVRRSVPDWGIDWYTDFYGVVRDEDLVRPGRLDVYTVSGIAQLNVLSWRHVLWYANTADRSVFTSEKAETILKTLVSYNATASATTGAGRLRNGPITNFVITVEADGANGNTLSSKGCAWENLLDALFDVSEVAGGDYDLIYNSGSHQWEFRWYTGQQGDDLRGVVTFSFPYDNMANPKYVAHRSSEKTVAIVLGKGKESDRASEIRTGGNYAAANDIEIVVNASHLETTAGLQTHGDQKLVGYAAIETFDFDPEQVAAYAYGKAYCVDGVLGDLVTGVWRDISADFQIDEVGLSVAKARAGSDIEQLTLGIRRV